MKRALKINFSATRKFEEIDYYFKQVIRRAVSATLDRADFPYNAEVSVTLCDADHIKYLNKTYRGVDKATDVLSFPLYDANEFDEAEFRDCAMLGDVVISIQRAHEQAKEIGNSFLEEIAFLTVHSVLHLLGYDHERSEEDDRIQCELQREIIANIEI